MTDIAEQLYVRVRFTRDEWNTANFGSDATPDGEAPSPGEVEDYVLLSLGDIVWVDNGAGAGTANDGILNGGEFGVNGVTVELYRDNGDNDPDPGGTDGAVIATTTTAAIGGVNGRYLFTGLEPGDYFVRIPETNFDTGTPGQDDGEPLYQYFSTIDQTTGGHDPDDDLNENAAAFSENGIDDPDPAANGINSLAVTLDYDDEPTNDGDGSYSNLTLDFGFLRYDYGDLPDTGVGFGVGDYQTLLRNGSGARHILDLDESGNGTYLGAGVDAELDGQPDVSAGSVAATGDDNSVAPNTDDEDGITFLTPIVPGEPFNIEITAHTADGADGYLNAWIDFDGDGELEAGERIASDRPITNGTNTYTFVAHGLTTDPPFAETLYSRFRFTRNTGEATSPTGIAPNGEVEDYVLMSLGDLIWRDNGAGGGTPDDGIKHADEEGIPGVVVELRHPDGTPVTDADGETIRATTDSNGRYLFTGLVPDSDLSTPDIDEYVVHVLKDNFDNVGDPLYRHFSSSDTTDSGNVDPDTDADDEDTDENGVDDTEPQNNGISSLPITLAYGTEPHSNGYSNRTLDFGFVAYDLGDLPDSSLPAPDTNSYPTQLADNGARHVIDVDASGAGTFLGDRVDAEDDGQPSVDADGDDNAPSGEPDDEDGIVFTSPIMPGQPFTIDIKAQTPNGANGYLNMWIDFDGSGTLDNDELLSPDRAITADGNFNSYTFTAPSLGVDVPFADTLYSRFRFTNNSGEVTLPTGRASNGEVEDYVLLSLGNLVWHDNGAGADGVANDGKKQSGESGIENVTVELYLSTQTPGVDTPIATTETDANGNYLFTGLTPDDYRVHIPAGEFGTTGDLYQYFSTTDRIGFENPNNNFDDDRDENGIGDETDTPNADGVSSGIVSLGYGSEPQGSGYANLTVDFGFLQYDFGDAPDSYGTTLTPAGFPEGGARHVIDGETYLGSVPDAETSGTDSVDADGDDANGTTPDDEDGVVFSTPIMPDTPFTVDVTAPNGGYLYAWIDYNGNGTFDADEQLDISNLNE